MVCDEMQCLMMMMMMMVEVAARWCWGGGGGGGSGWNRELSVIEKEIYSCNMQLPAP